MPRPGQLGVLVEKFRPILSAGAIFPLLKIMRLHNGVACGLVFIAGRLGLEQTTWPVELGAAVALGLLCIAAHLANDLIDLPADRANRPGRPLPVGELPLAVVRGALVVTWVLGLGLGLVLIPAWWLWWVFWSLTGPGYSILAKGKGWLAPLWTAGVITSCCIAGLWEQGVSRLDVLVLVFMFWYLVFREVVKTLADFQGDCLAGYRPLTVGINGARWGTFLLGLPLALLAGWFMLASSVPLQRTLGLVFLACLVGALVLVLKRFRPWPHLAGSLLKAGAFSGLALLFIISP